jgi:hypothetical protein
MLKVQAPDLDPLLLEAWDTTLNLTETWRRVLVDAGLQNVRSRPITHRRGEQSRIDLLVLSL